uniref:Uncharacterized protein n=3 Tax=Oryza TaxID=4527 RepID=A0A0E0MV46_ORYRU
MLFGWANFGPYSRNEIRVLWQFCGPKRRAPTSLAGPLALASASASLSSFSLPHGSRVRIAPPPRRRRNSGEILPLPALPSQGRRGGVPQRGREGGGNARREGGGGGGRRPPEAPRDPHAAAQEARHPLQA